MLVADKLLFGLGASVPADVNQLQSPLLQHAAHQAPAMALGRVLFAAKDGDAAPPGHADQPVDPLAERGRRRNPVVKHSPPVVVKIVSRRLAPQGVAQKTMLDPLLLQVGTQTVPVEVRAVLRIGARADVDDGLDRVPQEQVAERFEGMIGMADGEDLHAVGRRGATGAPLAPMFRRKR